MRSSAVAVVLVAALVLAVCAPAAKAWSLDPCSDCKEAAGDLLNYVEQFVEHYVEQHERAEINEIEGAVQAWLRENICGTLHLSGVECNLAMDAIDDIAHAVAQWAVHEGNSLVESWVCQAIHLCL